MRDSWGDVGIAPYAEMVGKRRNFVRFPLTSASETEGEIRLLQDRRRVKFFSPSVFLLRKNPPPSSEGGLRPSQNYAPIFANTDTPLSLSLDGGYAESPQAFPSEGKVARLHAATDEVSETFAQ